jgi:GT2 family glycosyltransferase
MKIAILIPVFNNLPYTQTCLQNITGILDKDETRHVFEVIVIDDGSTDGTKDWVTRNYKHIHLLEGYASLWWSGGINMGAKYAIEKVKADYVLLWNNDIEIRDDYFSVLLKVCTEYDDSVLIGSKVYANMEKKIVWTMGGVFNPITGYTGMKAYMANDAEDYQVPSEADWLTGMGTLVPARVIRETGYWDAVNFPQYHGDTEYTYRAKLHGFRNVVDPRLVIWNDIENTGLNHGGSFSKLVRMTKDKRSLYNLKVNVKFHSLYAKSPFAYMYLMKIYFKLFAGFFKWKLLNLMGIKKPPVI